MRPATLAVTLLLAGSAAWSDERPKALSADDQRALLKLEDDFATAGNRGDYKAKRWASGRAMVPLAPMPASPSRP